VWATEVDLPSPDAILAASVKVVNENTSFILI